MIYGIDPFTEKQKERYFAKLRQSIKDIYVSKTYEESKTPEIAENYFVYKWYNALQKNSDVFPDGYFEVNRKIVLDLLVGKMEIWEYFRKYGMDVNRLNTFMHVVERNGVKILTPKDEIRDIDESLYFRKREIPTNSELTESDNKIINEWRKKMKQNEIIEVEVRTMIEMRSALKKSKEDVIKYEKLILEETQNPIIINGFRNSFDLMMEKCMITNPKDFLVYIGYSLTDDVKNMTVGRTRIKITNDLIDKVTMMTSENKTSREIETETGLSPSSVSKIKSGKVTKK